MPQMKKLLLMRKLFLGTCALIVMSTSVYAMTDKDKEYVEFCKKYENNEAGFNKMFNQLVEDLGGETAGKNTCYGRSDGSTYCEHEWNGKGSKLTEFKEGEPYPKHDRTISHYFSNGAVTTTMLNGTIVIYPPGKPEQIFQSVWKD
jgi:hypothetical protein